MKNLWKKCSVVLLALALMITAAGCGNSEEAPTPGNGGDSDGTMQTSGTSRGEEQADKEDDEDVSDITVAFYNTVVPNEINKKRVEDAINAITIPEINTKVTLNIISMGQWDQQVNLMLSSGEKLDLMPTFFAGATSFNTMAGTNQLAPLNELMDEHGQGIKDILPEKYLDTTSFDGVIYGVPIHKDNVSGLYYAMRTDTLEALGLTEQAGAIGSMDDIEALLKVVKEKTDLIPLCETATAGILSFQNVLVYDSFDNAFFYDRLLNDYIVAADEKPDTAVSLYDLDEYKACISLFEKWYNEGLINKDAAASESHAEYHIAAGDTFSTFFSAETSTVTAFRTKAVYPVTIIKVCDMPLTTGTVNTLDWVIPVTSREPDAAMKFLNMMYTDGRIVNLLNYGEENVDYVINADGTYGFPEGVDINTAGYHFEMSWLFANQFLAGVWEGDAANLREVALEANNKAKMSPLFGFSASGKDMDTQLAGILSACNEYTSGLQSGSMSVEENLPKFQDKLKAAGIDEVTANVQEQLTQWLGSK